MPTPSPLPKDQNLNPKNMARLSWLPVAFCLVLAFAFAIEVLDVSLSLFLSSTLHDELIKHIDLFFALVLSVFIVF